LTRPLVTAGPIERNRIPAKVPVDIGSGFGVGVAAGVAVGNGLGAGDGKVAAFESCWASKFTLVNNDRISRKKVRRSWRTGFNSFCLEIV